METLQSIIRLVEKNCYMASLDLKDAYYMVGVSPSHRKYLRFMWKDVLYQFTCLPNGLSSCPRKFTKLLKPPLTELQKKVTYQLVALMTFTSKEEHTIFVSLT